MPLDIPMATSAAARLVLGLPEKKCHNVFAEPNPNDPKNKIVLVESAGSLQRNTFASACRGMWQADGHASGKVLIAQGTTLSTFLPSTNTVGALTGSIAGTDRGDFAFTESEGFGLFNGGLYVSDGSAIAAVTDADFATLLSDAGETAFTSVSTLGQRGLFTFGPRFGFTAVLDLDNTTALNYYTAESSPDDLIAGKVVGELYYLFGTQTIEAWAQTGDANDPFALQPGMTQQVGCACRDGIIRADNTLFFLDHAFNPRRLGSGGSQIINPEDPWVTDLLKTAGAANIRGMKEEDKAHTFIIWRTPNGCVAYDVLTQRWHTKGTNQTDTWRYTSMVTVGPTDSARTFVADDTGQFDELSRNYTSESMADASTMGTEIVREFTAYLPWPEFKAVPAIMLKGAKGVGSATGQGVAPVVLMRMSFDRGQTWTSWRSRSIGAQGAYDAPSIWRMNGSTKRDGVVFHFLKSDPVEMAYTGIEDVAA